jgi:hypothetical protein
MKRTFSVRQIRGGTPMRSYTSLPASYSKSDIHDDKSRTTSELCLKNIRGTAGAALMLVVALLLGMVAAGSARAQTLTVLHNIAGSPDGQFPSTGLVQDASGNLYGTTYYGGSSGNR